MPVSTGFNVEFMTESSHQQRATDCRGGERQRIAIARAILKNSPIVILDEATSSTDIENEEKVRQALLEFTKDKTLIVITHKINTIINADKIIYMDNGKILCSGTHEELMRDCSKYRYLYELTN